MSPSGIPPDKPANSKPYILLHLAYAPLCLSMAWQALLSSKEQKDNEKEK